MKNFRHLFVSSKSINNSNKLNNTMNKTNNTNKKSVSMNKRHLQIETLESRELLSVNPLLPESFGNQDSAYVAEPVIQNATAAHNAADVAWLNQYGLSSYENDTSCVKWNSDGRIAELYISNSNITGTSLDCSALTALTSLDCWSNNLSTLDVSKNTALTYLYCWDNNLSVLDVSKNTALRELSCVDNNLSVLDVSKNTALTGLYCYSNNLSTLDVSKNTALTYLSCSSNNLSTLDVSKNTALTDLYCSSNNLSTLDVSKNTALTELSCGSNNLSTLDVSKNTALTELYCWDNNLSTLDVSKNTALTELRCYNNNLSTLDVSKNTALTSLHCYNNNLSQIIGAVGRTYSIEAEHLSDYDCYVQADSGVTIIRDENTSQDINSFIAELENVSSGHSLIEFVEYGGSIYVLSTKIISSTDYRTDPDGTKNYNGKILVTKITGGEIVEQREVSQLYAAHPNDVASLSKDRGTIAVINGKVKVFFIENTYSYAQNGYIYTLNTATLALENSSTLFTGANWGWYPYFTENGNLYHFSFAGYYQYVNTTSIAAMQPNSAFLLAQNKKLISAGKPGNLTSVLSRADFNSTILNALKSKCDPSPVTLTYSDLTENSVTLKWSEVDGAANYKIQFIAEGQSYTFGNNITSHEFSGLNSEKIYHAVLGVDYGDGKYVPVKMLRFETLPADLTPTKPEGFRVVNGSVTKNSVTLTWKDDSSVNYNLRYRVNGATDWEVYALNIWTGGEFNVTDLTAGLKYDFQLTAVNINGTATTELIGKVETQNDGTDYAVLFLGGIDVMNNFPAFYYTLKAAYSVLKDQYGLLPENIYVLYADGNDPGIDTFTRWSYDKNENKYIDENDKINSDVSFITNNLYPATSKNFDTVMNRISDKMTNDNDHLLVWTHDHGNQTLFGESICAWGTVWGLSGGSFGKTTDLITDDDFEKNMKKIENGYVTMVLDQCYSGGILDNIFDPKTGKTRSGFSTNVHWYGMASANHDETAVVYDNNVNEDGYLVKVLGLSANFFSVIQQDPSIKTEDVYREALKLFPKGKIDVTGESYKPNGSADKMSWDQHPWQAGENISIFTSAALTKAQVSSGLSANSISTTVSNSNMKNALELTVNDSTTLNFNYRNPFNCHITAVVTINSDALSEPMILVFDENNLTEDEWGNGKLTTNYNLGQLSAGSYNIQVDLFAGDESVSIYKTLVVNAQSLDVADTLSGNAANITISNNNENTLTAKIGDGQYGGKDVDFYTFNIDTSSIGKTLLFASFAKGEIATNTYLQLFNATGTVLASSVFLGDSSYSKLFYNVTTAGTFYLAVSALSNTNYHPQTAESGTEGSVGGYEVWYNIIDALPDLTHDYEYSWINKITLTTQSDSTASSEYIADNNNLYINYRYKNNGYASATAGVTNRVTITGQNGYNVSHDFIENELLAAESFHALSQNYNWGKLAAGIYTITIQLDVNNTVAETNETNNIFSTTFEIFSSIDPPKNLRAVTTAKTVISLDWNNVDGATDYIVQRKTGSGDWTQIYNGMKSQFVDQNLTAGTTYSYHVQAVGSEFSEEINVATLSAGVSDVPVITKSELNTTNKTATLKWVNLGNDYTYYVFRNGALISQSQTTAEYNDRNVPTTTRYLIYAYNNQTGEWTKSLPTVLSSAPVQAEIVSHEVTAQGGIKLNWNIPGSSQFIIFRNGIPVSGNVSGQTWTDATPLAVSGGNQYTLYVNYLDSRGYSYWTWSAPYVVQKTTTTSSSASSAAQTSTLDNFWADYDLDLVDDEVLNAVV